MLVYDIKVTLSTVKLSTHSFLGFLHKVHYHSTRQQNLEICFKPLGISFNLYSLSNENPSISSPIFFFIIVPLQCNGRQESGQLSDTWGTFIRVTDDHGYNDFAWLACPSFVWWHSPGRLHITDHHLLNYRPEKSGTTLSCKFFTEKTLILMLY